MTGIPANSTCEASAAADVLAWLRDRNPGRPFPDRSPPFGALVEEFLHAVAGFDFTLQLVNHGTAAEPLWAGYWTHRGSAFAGFKQAEDHADAEVSRLLCCAALLQNQWCLDRLR